MPCPILAPFLRLGSHPRSNTWCSRCAAGRPLAATVALITCVAFGFEAPAQGPVYRERWSYFYLERLRETVFDELKGRDPAARRRVAEMLAEPARGMPYVIIGRTLAWLRDVEPDAAFLLRASLGAFTLPEVVDPGGTKEICRDLNATLFLPHQVEPPDEIEFVVTARDARGALVFEDEVARRTRVDDLRRARTALTIPCQDLADGRYLLAIETRIDGQGPRRGDRVFSRVFHVLRGYQARSEAAIAKTKEVHTALAKMDQALLLGIAAEVHRAYSGEASDGESDAVNDLLRLEQALANLEEKRHVLHGMTGDVPAQVPAGAMPMPCVLRLDAAHHPASGTSSRPLVVFADGAPAYDLTAHRPTAPAARGPRWLASALADFGHADDFDVAFLASPGGGRDYANALPGAIDSLKQLFAVEERPVVLVCEREAASAVGLTVASHAPRLAGLVLIGGGAMPASALEALGGCRVRIATLAGHPSTVNLSRMVEFVEGKREAGEFEGDLARLSTKAPAWLFGTRTLAGPIREFVLEIAGS